MDSDDVELWRLPRVLEKVSTSRATLYAKISAGSFPKPVHLDGKSVAWVSHEVDSWIAARIAERDRALAGK
jgi:prophage regulatory protein